jgi:hypothetical protein
MLPCEGGGEGVRFLNRSSRKFAFIRGQNPDVFFDENTVKSWS